MSRVWVPRTLRARLAMWHVAAMVLVLMVYATAVFALVRHNASQALDDRLRGDFRWAAEMAQQGPDGTLTWFDAATRARKQGPGTSSRWSDRIGAGRITLHTAAAPKQAGRAPDTTTAAEPHPVPCASRLLKKSAPRDRQIDPVVLR